VPQFFTPKVCIDAARPPEPNISELIDLPSHPK